MFVSRWSFFYFTPSGEYSCSQNCNPESGFSLYSCDLLYDMIWMCHIWNDSFYRAQGFSMDFPSLSLHPQQQYKAGKQLLLAGCWIFFFFLLLMLNAVFTKRKYGKRDIKSEIRSRFCMWVLCFVFFLWWWQWIKLCPRLAAVQCVLKGFTIKVTDFVIWHTLQLTGKEGTTHTHTHTQ